MSLALLERQFRRISQLQHVSAILQWDEAVMMPPAAGDDRASALAGLGVVVHEHLTAPQLPDWIAAAEAERAAGKLDLAQAASLREIRRVVQRASALPSDLVEAISRAQLRCEQAWRRQRADNNWQDFAPLLREVVERKREAAAALAEVLGVNRYDALLDEYEPFYCSDGSAHALRGGASDGSAHALRGGASDGSAHALRGGASDGSAHALRGGASDGSTHALRGGASDGSAHALRGGASDGSAHALHGGASDGSAHALRGGASDGSAHALRGGASANIDALFARLRGFLPGLIDDVIEKQKQESYMVPRGPFPKIAQELLGRRLMAAVGFDMAHGRLDVSHHPFCGGVSSDVRVTTRYDENDFSSGMLGVLHETGHAKYEQGRPRAWIDLPVGEARSMSLHESQSLLSEMQISRTPAFLRFAAPLIAGAFPAAAAAQPEAFSADNLARWFTRVARSKIRTESDEVTYPCHILIRYDIERALIDAKLDVEAIPDAWDQGMRDLLGISTAGDYRDGCMQDVHWPGGAFGYFPTYTLGAMIAAQIFAAIERALPDVWSDIARGEFGAINAFLRERIWSQASLHTTDELLTLATGEPLNPDYFERHLRRRYLGGA